MSELGERVGDPAGQLAAFIGFDRRLHERGGDVTRILAEGRRQHPDLGTAYEEGRCRGDRERQEIFSSWPAECGFLGLESSGLSPSMVLVSLMSFDAATREYGWSPIDVEAWWYTTLAELLREWPRSAARPS